MKKNKFSIIIILVFSLLLTSLSPCEAVAPFIMYQTLVELAYAVGGPHVLVSILVSTGVITGATGALVLAKLGMATATVATTTPWWSNPWTAGAVVISSAAIGAGLYYYLKDVTKEDLILAVTTSYNKGALTFDKYLKALAILK